jgi:hypothetical protein
MKACLPGQASNSAFRCTWPRETRNWTEKHNGNFIPGDSSARRAAEQQFVTRMSCTTSPAPGISPVPTGLALSGIVVLRYSRSRRSASSSVPGLSTGDLCVKGETMDTGKQIGRHSLAQAVSVQQVPRGSLAHRVL